MKKIEQLDLRMTCLVTDHPAIVASVRKINELVDAVNQFGKEFDLFKDMVLSTLKSKESEEPTLKNCPFCNCEAEVFCFDDDFFSFGVKCSRIGCIKFDNAFTNRIAASEWWNTRKGEE